MDAEIGHLNVFAVQTGWCCLTFNRPVTSGGFSLGCGKGRLLLGECLENGTLALVDRVLARHAGMVSEQLLLGVGVNTLYFRMFTCHVSPWKHALMPVFPPADLRH